MEGHEESGVDSGANWGNYTIYWMFYGLSNFWDLIILHRDTDVAITRECFNS
jgi:hypothetical protein